MPLTFGNKVENNGATSAGKLSAEEFNQLVRQVNTNEDNIQQLDEKTIKQLKLNGTTYTPDKYGLVEAAINVGTQQSDIVITQKEHKVGLYEDEEGTQHDIYECAFALTELPTAANSTKEYELSSEPLGFGKYLHVIGLEMVSDDGNTFFYGNYFIERVYVSELRTKCVIRCVQQATGCNKVTLRMRYLKYYGDRIVFSVTVPDGISVEDVNLSVAPLKYNKHFAFTYTADDSVVGAYSRIWRRINKKWIDDTEFFHMGMAPTSGYIPANTLCMTDGCGNDRRFGFGVAIWPTLRDEYHPNGRIADSSSSKTNIYITWEELRVILDFGGSVYFHNMDETKYDKTVVPDIIKGLKDDQDKAFEKLGRKMKVLALPDGLQTYVDAGREANFIAFMRSSLSNELIYLKSCGDLWKGETYGGNHTSDIALKLEELAAQASSDNPYWVAITSHRVDLKMMEMIEMVYSLYGAAGADNIWVASWDEIFEYVSMREGLSFAKKVEGKKVSFEIYVPKGNGYYFRDLSFLLSGVTAMDGVTVGAESDTIKGISSGINNSSLLVNINFNPELVKMAEKYTSRYEATAENADKEDALYFVGQLLPVLKTPYENRINAVEPGVPGRLSIDYVTINNGAESTTDRSVSLSVGFTGTPTHYRASESSNLTGAGWILYSSAVIPFVLSTALGTKTVYVQLKNDSSESNVLSGTIELKESATPGTIILNGISINNGSSTSATRNVTVSIDATTTPTHYRIAENGSFSDTEWIVYTETIQYTLSPGNGTKTIYVQVKNATNESEIKNAQITLQESITPSTMRAILSLGWDYTAGGAVGSSTFDTEMKVSKLRLGEDNTSYSIYDADGNIVGSAVVNGLLNTGAGYLGLTTGDNSGIYPDKVLKYNAYKRGPTEEATIEMNIPAGQYQFKVLININNMADHSMAQYTLEHAGNIQTFPMLSRTVSNFTDTMNLNLTVGNQPVIVRMKTSDTKNAMIFINCIEIIQQV